MHYKQNNKESKTYVQGLRQFGNTLPRGLKGILKKNGYNYSEIIGKWKSLVGIEIAKYTIPKTIKMTKGNSKGTLILGVKRGNEIQIEYSKNEILNKINSFFGYQLITEIKLQSYNSEEKKGKNKKNKLNLTNKLKEKVYKIKNQSIKESLSKLLDAAKND